MKTIHYSPLSTLNYPFSIIKMTQQIPDTCTFDGRRWEITDWDGNYEECIPSNEAFGIETTSPHTANWSGRIDHFLVFKDQLYLAKMEVTLPEDFDPKRLKRYRREVVTRYEPMVCFDSKGERETIREDRLNILFFDDMAIPFTGTLHLLGPYIDGWEIPEIAAEDEPDERELRLKFECGKLIESDKNEPELLAIEASKFESLWDYCTSNNRLVPMPQQWNELYKMLRNTHQKPSGGWEPPLPLILAAWQQSTPAEKQLRFKGHLKWADEQNQLELIEAFLSSLPETNWCHFGEE